MQFLFLYIFDKMILGDYMKIAIASDHRGVTYKNTIIEYLKSKDKKIVALSNWFTEMNKTRLENAGLLKYFDRVYCSDEVDMKPNFSSYITACGDTPLSETVMIGDSLQLDVIRPLELGMDALWFCPNEKKPVDRPKVKVIRRLNEIKEMY